MKKKNALTTLLLLIALLLLVFARRAGAQSLAWEASLYADAKEVPLASPEGVACGADGTVAVADTGNHRVLLLALKDGAFTAPVELKPAQLQAPARVQLDGKGGVLVLDRRGHRIARLSGKGELAGFVDPEGVPPARGLLPIAFRAGAAGELFLLDAASSRVVQLDAAGKFARELPLPKGSFTDLAVDGRATLYALDAVAGAVFAADATATAFRPLAGGLKEYASFAAALTAGERGRLLLVDKHGDGLVALGADGAFLGRQLGLGWSDGLLYYPSDACVMPGGEVVVADRGNNRVQAFTPGK